MSICMPSDTCRVLGERAERCESRSLFMDRFAHPAAKDSSDVTPRRDWFRRLIGKDAVRKGSSRWLGDLAGVRILHAQLQSRLLVNTAGGVMENAGLCLDRFGMPFIPGSAAKGCARRMAIQELLEAETAREKSELLVQIAIVFGWGDTDWKPGRKQKDGKETECHSEFWWAMATDDGDDRADSQRQAMWGEVLPLALTELTEQLRLGDSARIAPDLPACAGRVSFLMAQPKDVSLPEPPVKIPTLGQLELDVVTCHHPRYYADPLGKPVALDDEDPNPVVFPAVAAGHVFAFALAPLRFCPDELMEQARHWLSEGLEIFGLGAKTAAGYGWFDCDEERIDKPVREDVDRRQKVAEEVERNRLAREQTEKEEEERIRKKRATDARRSELSPEEREDLDLDEMERGTLLQHIEKLEKHPSEKQTAVYRLLHRRNPDLWRELRDKAERGKPKEKKRFSPVVQALYKMAKDLKEKMPK